MDTDTQLGIVPDTSTVTLHSDLGPPRPDCSRSSHSDHSLRNCRSPGVLGDLVRGGSDPERFPSTSGLQPSVGHHPVLLDPPPRTLSVPTPHTPTVRRTRGTRVCGEGSSHRYGRDDRSRRTTGGRRTPSHTGGGAGDGPDGRGGVSSRTYPSSTSHGTLGAPSHLNPHPRSPTPPLPKPFPGARGPDSARKGRRVHLVPDTVGPTHEPPLLALETVEESGGPRLGDTFAGEVTLGPGWGPLGRRQ